MTTHTHTHRPPEPASTFWLIALARPGASASTPNTMKERISQAAAAIAEAASDVIQLAAVATIAAGIVAMTIAALLQS